LLLSERPPRELADLLCTERTADCNDKSPTEVDVGLDGETKSIAGGAGATTRDSTGLDAGSADDAERGADSNVQKTKGTKKKKKKVSLPLVGGWPLQKVLPSALYPVTKSF
jgi:hypothetical protein